MDPICTGTFILDSQEGGEKLWAALGAPEEDCKLLNQKGKMEITQKNGIITWTESYALCPKYNNTYICKLGETMTTDKPFPMSLTLVKKDSRSISTSLSFGPGLNNKMDFESVFSKDGMTGTGNGNGVPYSTFYARVEPEISGSFLLEDKKSLVDFFVAQGEDKDSIEAILTWSAFRQTEKEGRIFMEEILGNKIISYNHSLGEEFEMKIPNYGTQVGVMTSDFPGSYTLVTRKSGVVATWNWIVDDSGMTGTVKSGKNDGSFFYKRITDIWGKWKLVSPQAGLEDPDITVWHPKHCELKPLGGGRWIFTAEGDYPDIDFTMDEEYSYKWNGENITEVSTLTPDMKGFVTISKSGGKTTITEATVTKNFMILKTGIENLPNSTSTFIYIRQ